jgi:hypothetical protein
MIAFTYDLSTAVGQTRLCAGDTDPAGLNRTGGDRTRTDEEVAFLLAANGGDARLAAAALLEGKAAEFAAVAVHVTQGSLAQDFRQRSAQMLAAARSLRDAVCVAAWNPPASPDRFNDERE